MSADPAQLGLFTQAKPKRRRARIACQTHSPTSKAAARAIRPHAPRIDDRIEAALQAAGAVGMTDDELEVALELGGSTVRPSRGRLEERGLVVRGERCRPTRSGGLAAVNFHVEFAAALNAVGGCS